MSPNSYYYEYLGIYIQKHSTFLIWAPRFIHMSHPDKRAALTEASPLVKGAKPHGLGAIACLLFPVALGWAVEFYDYGCFTTLTKQIQNNFFPDLSSDMVWLVFSIGQVTRPFGGAVLGFVADRYGRRLTIIVATVGMLAATCTMGALPSLRCCGKGWNALGIVLLCLCRAIQGLFAAGEVSAATVLAVESVSAERICFAMSMLMVAGHTGFLVASGMTEILESSLDEQAMLDWGWRLPFFLSLPFGVASALLQQRLVRESAEFDESSARQFDESSARLELDGSATATEAAGDAGSCSSAERGGKGGSGGSLGGGGGDGGSGDGSSGVAIGAAIGAAPSTHLGVLWARHRLAVLLAVLFGASHTGMFYGTASYIKSFLHTIHASTAADGSGIQSIIYAAGIVALPLVALAADALGAARAAVIGLTASLLLALPSWLLLVSHSPSCLPYLGGVLFAILHAATSIPLLTLMVSLTPPPSFLPGPHHPSASPDHTQPAQTTPSRPRPSQPARSTQTTQKKRPTQTARPAQTARPTQTARPAHTGPTDPYRIRPDRPDRPAGGTLPYERARHRLRPLIQPRSAPLRRLRPHHQQSPLERRLGRYALGRPRAAQRHGAGDMDVLESRMLGGRAGGSVLRAGGRQARAPLVPARGAPRLRLRAGARHRQRGRLRERP